MEALVAVLALVSVLKGEKNDCPYLWNDKLICRHFTENMIPKGAPYETIGNCYQSCLRSEPCYAIAVPNTAHAEEFGDFVPCLMAKGNPDDNCQCASNNQSFEFYRPSNASNHQECTVEQAAPTTTTAALTTVAMTCPAVGGGLTMTEDDPVLGTGCFMTWDTSRTWTFIEEYICPDPEMIKITEYEHIGHIYNHGVWAGTFAAVWTGGREVGGQLLWGDGTPVSQDSTWWVGDTAPTISPGQCVMIVSATKLDMVNCAMLARTFCRKNKTPAQ